MAQPVDATKISPDLKGVRTIFNGFHHFKPEAAERILQDAVQSRSPIAIFELAERSVPNLISFFLIPLMVFFFVPVMGRFSLARFVFTYLIPVIPLFIAWDGLVSHLRAYSPKELTEMTLSLEGYSWEVIRRPVGKGPVQLTALVGVPK
jgi:hypothetical protein